MNYAQHFNPNKTPQNEKADSRQIANSAGGHSFQLDKWKRLDRWLILGAEGGSYYATEHKLTRENAKTVGECLDEDGPRAVEQIASISEQGRAPKNDPAIFALALAASHKDEAVRRAALAALPRVCRIGTHLFHFVQAVDSFRGWGPGLRRAVSSWYSSRSTDQLCYQVAKYQQRDGWSNRDLLRLSHASPKLEHAAVYRWISGAGLDAREVAGSIKAKRGARNYPASPELPAFLAAFDELKTADEKRTIQLIREHGFSHEMIDTRHKNSADVWEALLEKMPPGALVRNLGKMTAVGLLKPMSASIPVVAARLTDEAKLRKARVHPIDMLKALLTYRRGHGNKGKLTWDSVSQICDALDAGFYTSFGAVVPSGARTLLAIDVSGSMESGTVAGVNGLTPRIAAGAMAMVTARVEKQWHAVGFSNAVHGSWTYGSGRSMHGGWNSALMPLAISPRQRLDDVCKTMAAVPMGGTDCSLPMLYAAAQKIEVDCFAVYTDSETWAGDVHPHQALSLYRNTMGIDAKLVVVGMVANEFTIAHPDDAGMLDVVGFDTAAPAVIADFSRVGSAEALAPSGEEL